MSNFWENIENFDEEYRNVRVILEKILMNVEKSLTLLWINFRICIENTRKFWEISIKLNKFLIGLTFHKKNLLYLTYFH